MADRLLLGPTNSGLTLTEVAADQYTAKVDAAKFATLAAGSVVNADQLLIVDDSDGAIKKTTGTLDALVPALQIGGGTALGQILTWDHPNTEPETFVDFVYSGANNRLGVNVATPFANVAGGTASVGGEGLDVRAPTAATQAALIVEGDASSIYFIDRNGGADDKVLRIRIDASRARFEPRNDDLTVKITDAFVMNLADGAVYLGTIVTPTMANGRLQVKANSATHLAFKIEDSASGDALVQIGAAAASKGVVDILDSTAVRHRLTANADSYLCVSSTVNALGVGTATPGAYKLHVYQAGPTDNIALFESSDADARIGVKDNGANYAWLGFQDSGLNLQTGAGATTRLFIRQSDGMVGINTINPKRGLHVHNSGTETTLTTSRHVAVFQRSGAGAAASVVIVSANDQQASLDFGDTDAIDIGRVLYDHNDNSMALVVNAAEALEISNAQDVGIDMNSATIRSGLHIGSDKSQTFENDVYILANAYNDGSWKYLKGTAQAAYYIRFDDDDAAGMTFATAPEGNANAALTWTNRVFINDGGVTIGSTVSPAAKAAVLSVYSAGVTASDGIRVHDGTNDLILVYEKNSGVGAVRMFSAGSETARLAANAGNWIPDLHVGGTAAPTAGYALDVSGDALFDSEVHGTPREFAAGLNRASSLGTSSSAYLYIGNAVLTTTEGILTRRAGSIVGLTLDGHCDVSTSGVLKIEVLVAGSVVFSASTASLSGPDADFSANATQDRNVDTFSANQTLALRITTDSNLSISAIDCFATLAIFYDD